MKRKLWIMVAITALMMGLWYTAKAADGSLPAFTKQPQNATIAWNGFCKVTWDTNYPPVSAQVQYHNISNNGWETYSDPYYLVGGQIAEDKLSANFHYNDYLKGKEFRIYVRCSEQEDDDYGRIYSQPFMISYIQSIITFDAGGGNGNMPKTYITEELPYSYTLPDCDFTWVGHVFDKWQVGTEYYQPGDEIQIMSDTTIRATWKKYCTVTFDANGGTGSMASYNVTLLEGEPFTLPECAYTAPEGQRFRGYWNVSSELGGKRPGDVITVTKNTTISPLWSTIAYSTITFDMMSYGEQISPVTVEWGSVPPRPADPTASGMYFTGWYTTAYGASNSMAYYYYRGWDKPLSENVTLYAGWVTDQIWKLTLVYDEDAGQVSLSTYAAREGETVNVTINANEHYTYDYMSYGTMQSSQKSFTMPGKDIYVQVYFTCDHNHTASSMTFHEAVAPTCEEPGNYIYYICPVCGRWAYEMPWTYVDTRFELISDHDRILIPALGHEYGVPAYEWAEDFSTVTATRVCVRDTSHIESEIVSVSAAVTKEPGPLSKGEHTYTSEEFENPAFSAQTFVLDDIDPLGIPVTEQFFPDSQFRSIAAQKDTDNNGYLSLAERDAVTLLNGTNKRIVTYEGIQYFPNLIELAGQNNTALEVLDVSMNSHLQRLTLNNSAKLTALDFSANPEMTYIQATNCGAATVNVANSPNLTYLNIIGNPVTNLDLSGNPLLETLYVYNSSLKELDLGSNPYILEACNGTYTAAVQYEQYVSGSYSLRAGKNTVIRNGDEMLINRASFPDESLRTYVENNFDTNENSWLTHVEINEANEIVLESAAELTSLEGIEYFTELDGLIVGDTPLLTSVDLSANTKIKNLDIYDTGLVSLNVSGLKLEFLGCVRSQLTSLTLGIQPNLWYLSCNGNPSISTLDISGAQHLITAWLGTKDSSAAEYDRYTADGYILDVDKDTAIITGLPTPTFVLPSALTTIESEAFSGISAVTVVIPKHVTAISGNPFAGSSVTTIYGGEGTAAQTLANTYGYNSIAVSDDWIARQ
ncbi:MAG: InlB B-repeat-containing protein [Clostridia bacterium]|nr:InlB B-repeat-containing protein [Clostridia bacterium]